MDKGNSANSQNPSLRSNNPFANLPSNNQSNGQSLAGSDAQLEELRKKGLFPLPDKDYTSKYKWFRRLSNTKIGLAFLMRTLPLIKRER